jgi:predicted O-methyltransferase YrrM
MPTSSPTTLWHAITSLARRRPPEDASAQPADVPASYVPPGHFHSPIPSLEDIESSARRHKSPDQVPGVELNEADQLVLLGELTKFYPTMPFRDEATPGFRYRFDNPSYSYADGILLHTMLRYLRPRRVVEVGSGYTSALTLDTNEHFLGNQVSCSFIEPHPNLLLSLITEKDLQSVRVIRSRLQDVDLRLFDELEAGDILFIDSTHVSKVDSDVNCLFFDVLPRLKPGTLIHLHDVFPSFEYPLDWLRHGRAWNEQYVLRAFLQFNASFRIRLFGSHMIDRYPDWFRTHMPLCLKNPGGAFWMQRIA